MKQAEEVLEVSVGALCDFAARQGDLDHRFTPGPSALEGAQWHRRRAAAQSEGVVAEVAVAAECAGLRVRGRIDSVVAAEGRLEEVKTTRGEWRRLSLGQQERHRAQLRCYGALWGRQEGREVVHLRRVYLDIRDGSESYCDETVATDVLWAELEERCERYRHWAEAEAAHRRRRNEALEALAWPLPAYRDGQRELAVAVYRAIRHRRSLLLQAPTGLGKTLGTLFPSLKAMPREDVDRIFYLTVRGTARQLALDGLRELLAPLPGRSRTRVLVMMARDTLCEYPDRACQGDSCPLARGFYDRLAAARAAALSVAENSSADLEADETHATPAPSGDAAAGAPAPTTLLDETAVREIARRHEICPYYLAQDLARWADVVVADVNYYFDVHALLHAYAVQEQWRVAVLVDEAHNLIERARQMYSAELREASWREAARGAAPPLQRALRRSRSIWREWRERESGWIAELPEAFLTKLQRLTTDLLDHFSDHAATPAQQDLLFEVLAFVNLAEKLADHSALEWQADTRRLALHNLVPADWLAPRWRQAASATLFSATLTPFNFQRDLLGLPADVFELDLPSPFSAQQLQVKLVTDLPTALAQREHSAEAIASRVSRRFNHHPGNYLVFVSSFAYLRLLHQALLALDPALPVIVQAPGMSPAERQRFLDGFEPGGMRVGLAVLGGVFGEGVDLPGSRLIGAFVVTLGLAPQDARLRLLHQRLADRFGQQRAYAYATLYPGLQRVIQAAGRVVRTPADYGVIELIDPRWQRKELRRLLPSWWPIQAATETVQGADAGHLPVEP